jgi:hypothetical protein
MTSSHARPRALAVSVVLFGLGLLSIVIIFGLHATGAADLPTWLNVATMLAPLGLATGVISVVVHARRDTR